MIPVEERPIVDLDAVRRAAEVVGRHARRTPLLGSRTLGELVGAEVEIKAEMFQRTGAYKLRGALNRLAALSAAERERGVVCSSAGNHAQGVACAARALGVRAVVAMAENATPAKIQATRDYGAEVVLHGRIWDEANAHAEELAARDGLVMVHPFDDPVLIAGQGTLGLEIVEDRPDVDVIVVPIGGGGLISGVATAAKGVRPGCRVIGVESADAPGMTESVRAGRPVRLDRVDSVIDGLRVQQVGTLPVQIVRERVDEIVTVPDRAIFDAVVWMMERTKLVPEAAAAAPVAALLAGLVPVELGERVVCVASGGNVDLTQLRGLSWN